MEFSYFSESQLASEDIPVCLSCQGVLKEPFVRCCSCVFKVELCLEVSHASVQSKLKLTFGYLVLFKVEQIIPGETLLFFSGHIKVNYIFIFCAVFLKRS